MGGEEDGESDAEPANSGQRSIASEQPDEAAGDGDIGEDHQDDIGAVGGAEAFVVAEREKEEGADDDGPADDSQPKLDLRRHRFGPLGIGEGDGEEEADHRPPGGHVRVF